MLVTRFCTLLDPDGISRSQRVTQKTSQVSKAVFGVVAECVC